jgi:hypothetical protein
MLAFSKFRVISALLLFWLVVSVRMAAPADASLRRSPAAPAPHRTEASPQVPRPLLRQEIFQAIQRRLQQEGNTRRENLRPRDLMIQTSLPVLDADAGLKVKKISFDRLRRETVFELWTSGAPRYLPFDVATRRDPRLWGGPLAAEMDPAELPAESKSLTGRLASAAGQKPAVLAKPGSAATLVMLGENMRITLTVMPLQPGTKGQCILVRDAATARVMRVEVVGEGQLQAAL